MEVSQKTKGNELTNSTLNQPVTSYGGFRDVQLFKLEIYMPINIYIFRLSFQDNKYNSKISVFYSLL